MKKLFLTSGIIACMACPAFADLTPETVTRADNANSYTGTVASGNTGATATELSGSTVAGACVQPAMGTYSGTTTLSAIWTADPYKIIYKAGSTGGTHDFDQQNQAGATSNISNLVAVESLDYDDDPGTAKAANTFSIYGYHFKAYDQTNAPTGGWTSDRTIYGAAADNTTVNHYAPGTSLGTKYNVTSDTILTAQWEADTYTVHYSCLNFAETLGAGTAPSNATATYDSNYQFASNADSTGCYQNGYHFTGWACKNASGADITIPTPTVSGHSYTYANNVPWEYTGMANGDTVNCYATYVANTITLVYDEQGGSTVADGSCTYDSSITLPANPTKTGYTFGGWAISEEEDAQTPETGLRP